MKRSRFSRRIAVFSTNLSNSCDEWRVILAMCIITWRKKHKKKTGGVLPSVLGIEYTLSKTVLGKSAVISENQTATSDGERGIA